MMKQNCQQKCSVPDTRKLIMARNNTVRKYLIGRSYKNDEFDWSFLFRDSIMRVIEL